MCTKKILTAIAAALLCFAAPAQTEPVKFAFLADVHLCIDSPRIGNLERCIADINAQDDIQFVLFGGDITEFGADDEIALAKEVMDHLNKPYYVVAGNHDAKWSESGCNTFTKVFGYEQFDFEAGGIKFIGCSSGPNMRMAPALMPHECLVWLDSLANAVPRDKKVFFVNHYPQDTSVLNYFQVINSLKKTNIQLLIGGHWHSNRALNYDGVPGILGRSPDRGKEIGYNIMTIEDGLFSVREKVIVDSDGNAVSRLGEPWYSLALKNEPQYTPQEPTEENPYCLPEEFPWMKFDVNKKYGNVTGLWRNQEANDIGSGAAKSGRYILYTNTQGVVKAIAARNGEPIWEYVTDGKVFSTPAISDGRVVVGSTDGNIYCLSLRRGFLLWKYKCEKSVLAAPVIQNGTVYVGSSDHKFRAINLRSGELLWSFDDVKGFVECRPFIDNEQVVFGDWANTLYSLDPKSGELQWKWSTRGSRMLSPAATYPVKANGKIFFCTPERKTYAIDAKTGKLVWESKGGRESVGISTDGGAIFVKTMFGTVQSYLTRGNKCRKLWEVTLPGMGYEIAPTASVCTESHGRQIVFVPTDKGNIFCLDASDGSVLWVHKVSVALINSIEPLPGDKLLVSTMDGVVTMLKY